MAVNKLEHGYCIVAGGHLNDPAPDQSGTVKVIDPLRHGLNVIPEDMPFITMIRDTGEQESTPVVPDPGAVVLCEWETGSPHKRRIVGMPNEKNMSQTVPGNQDLVQGHIKRQLEKKTGKFVSNGTQPETRDGVPIKKTLNGQEYYHNLTRGLPTHAALYPMAGTIIQPINQIETAVQQAAQGLSPSMISQLPGQIMSIASMFKGMTSDQKSKAKEKMQPDVAEGFDSMLELMMMDGDTGAFAAGNRCNTEVYLERSIDLLSQCTNLSDLFDVMHRIQHDKNLRGLDTLPKVKVKSSSAFGGEFSYDMDAEGTLQFDDIDSNTANISVNTVSYIFSNTANVNVSTSSASSSGGSSGNKNALQAIQQFASLLQNGGTNPGIGQSFNQFGDQSQKVAELMGRVPQEAGSRFTNLQKSVAGRMSKTGDVTQDNLLGKVIGKYFR